MFRASALGVVGLVLITFAACSAAVAPRPSLDPDRPLVTVERHGGLCVEGECRDAIRIDANGSVHRLGPAPEIVSAIPVDLAHLLAEQIAARDFDLVVSRPFTGTCPTAYDGTEWIYTFHLPAGEEVIASCQVAIDPSDPMFRSISAIVDRLER